MEGSSQSQSVSNRVLSPSVGALLAAASIAVQQFTEGSFNPVEEFLAVMATISTLPMDTPSTNNDDVSGELNNNNNSSSNSENNKSKNRTARQDIAEQAMTAMTGVIEKMVTAGGSAAYHRKGIACLEVRKEEVVFYRTILINFHI